MSQPKQVSELMHQLILNNQNDPYAQILRHCPCVQIMMLKAGYMDVTELSSEELKRLGRIIDLEGLQND